MSTRSTEIGSGTGRSRTGSSGTGRSGTGAPRATPSRDPDGGGALQLADFLASRKVAELQEMWGFWETHGRAPRRKGELLDPLLSSLADETKVRARIKILSSRPRTVLLQLIRRDEYRAGLPDLVADGEDSALEPYEVEAAARALSKRGFVHILRGVGARGRGHETYEVPRDLGDLISALLHEERRGPRQVFSLAGHVRALAPAALRRLVQGVPGVEEGAGPEAVVAAVLDMGATALLSRIDDPCLQGALRRAAVEDGGIVSRERFENLLGPSAEWDRGKIQGILEDRGLGTVTSLAMGDYGVELAPENVCLFAEVTDVLLDEARTPEGPERDRVDAARVDLLTDLQQLLHLVATTPLRVTQGRTIYRAAQHRVLQAFTFCEDSLMDHRRVFDLLYELVFGLELVEVTEESRLKLTRKGAGWDADGLADKVRVIFDRFLEERLPEGRDFHVRRLRRAVAAALAKAPREPFLPLSDVAFRVRNDYLAAVEEEGVKDLYRNRFQYTYTPPRETPEELRAGLVDYVISRLYPLGMVDVALLDDVPVGVRLTRMGRHVLLGERLEETEPGAGSPAVGAVQPIVVNPDFEVILFPEGDVNEIAHKLNRFANRTKADEVSHYRITREGVERAVVKDMDAEEILEFLETTCRVPLPQNVEYSIREWAARVSFAWQRQVVLLTTSDPEALDRVLRVEEIKRQLVERISPTAAALRSKVSDWKVLEVLREAGVYFR